MERLQEATIILTLADALRARGSWCGETHLQKSVYFVKELSNVPLEFDFILYKHGPFSFDLRDELTAMRADGLLNLHVQPYPYGASLIPTESSKKITAKYLRTVSNFQDRIEFVADRLGNKGVAQLEQLATALYVTKKEATATKSIGDRAKRLHELKPHVSMEDARVAVEDVDQIIAEAAERFQVTL